MALTHVWIFKKLWRLMKILTGIIVVTSMGKKSVQHYHYCIYYIYKILVIQKPEKADYVAPTVNP